MKSSFRRHGSQCQRAGSLLMLVMGMALMLMLTLMYIQAPVGGPAGAGGPGALNRPQEVIANARTQAMALNTTTVNTNYIAWRASNPGRLEPEALRQFAQSQPMGGSAGAWFVHDEQVYNTTQLATPTFASLLGVE